MKVSVWHNNADIRLVEVPTPTPGPGEMLVKVLSCGICGSDVVEWYRLPRAPLVQGHEMGGEVAAVGRGVTGFCPGDRVFVAPKVPCLECRYCRQGRYPVCSGVKERLPGAFAEYVLVPAALVARGAYRLPDAVSYDQATFIEPLACAVRAQNLAGIQAGQVVLVLGCGMSGLLHVRLAKHKGCRVAATDLNAGRLRLAAKSGADPVLDAAGDVPGRLQSELGRKADAVILCTAAAEAIAQAWKSVDKGGAVVFFAVPGPGREVVIPVHEFWTQEVRVLTSYYCGPPDIQEALALLAAGKIAVDDLVTHRLPLGETAAGFRLVADGKESIKVIIKPHGAGKEGP
jgi:L-iditol 2-dehydrogenase